MKKSLMVIAAVALLAGCAQSMTSIRSEGPAQRYTSSKPADEVAKCILFAWQDTRLSGAPAQASLQPGRQTGTTVVALSGDYFADVDRKGEATIVDYYRVGNSWISKKLQPGVIGCL